MDCQATVLKESGDVAFFENALGEALQTQDKRVTEKEAHVVEEQIHAQINKAQIEHAIRSGGSNAK